VRWWYFLLFLHLKKKEHVECRNSFEFLLRTPANLIPCPYVPRITNEPSTWPITVHCGTSKTSSNNHLHISPPLPLPRLTLLFSSLHLRRSLPFLTESFKIMESLAEVRIVPLNSRSCIFIFRCRMVEKNTRERFAYFYFSLRQSRHFYWKIFASRKFHRISRIYHET